MHCSSKNYSNSYRLSADFRWCFLPRRVNQTKPTKLITFLREDCDELYRFPLNKIIHKSSLQKTARIERTTSQRKKYSKSQKKDKSNPRHEVEFMQHRIVQFQQTLYSQS